MSVIYSHQLAIICCNC